ILRKLFYYQRETILFKRVQFFKFLFINKNCFQVVIFKIKKNNCLFSAIRGRLKASVSIIFINEECTRFTKFRAQSIPLCNKENVIGDIPFLDATTGF